jgi:hypothetical protein
MPLMDKTHICPFGLTLLRDKVPRAKVELVAINIADSRARLRIHDQSSDHG